MIKRNFFIAILILVISIISVSSAHILPTIQWSIGKPDSTSLPCEPSNSTFQKGESLTYKIYYNWGWIWIGAGELVMNVKEDKDSYILTARGRTYPSYEWMFRVNDYFETHLDKETLRPTFSRKLLEEGGYRLYEELTYDWDENTVHGKRGKTVADITTYSEEIMPCSWDLISVMYALRTKNFEQAQNGDKTSVQVYLDKKTHDVDFVYQSKEKKEISKMGSYDVRKFYAMMQAGNTFGEDGARVDVYVSDDENKVPVYITSDLSVGSAKLILSEWDGLKYDFSAKYK